MALPQPVFVRDAITGEYQLSERAKKTLKDILQAQEVSRFLDLVGYTPHPDDPYPPRPWPFPWPGPWPYQQLAGSQFAAYANGGALGYPHPDDDGPWPPHIGPLIKEVLGDLVLDSIAKAPGKKGALSLVEAVKREGLAAEALTELHDKVAAFEKSLAAKAKASA